MWRRIALTVIPVLMVVGCVTGPRATETPTVVATETSTPSPTPEPTPTPREIEYHPFGSVSMVEISRTGEITPTSEGEAEELARVQEVTAAVERLKEMGVERLAEGDETLEAVIGTEYIESVSKAYVLFRGADGNPLLLAVAQRGEGEEEWQYVFYQIPPLPEEGLVVGWDKGQLFLVEADEGGSGRALVVRLGENGHIERSLEFGRLAYRFNPETGEWEKVEIVEVGSVSEMFEVMVERGTISEVAPGVGLYSNWILGHRLPAGFGAGLGSEPIRNSISAEERAVRLKNEIARALGMGADARVGIFICDQSVSSLAELESCGGIYAPEIGEIRGSVVPDSGVFRIGSGGSRTTIKEIFYDRTREIVIIFIGGNEEISRRLALLREASVGTERKDGVSGSGEEIGVGWLIMRDIASALRQTMLAFSLHERGVLDGPTLRAILRTRISNARDSGPPEWGSCLDRGDCHIIDPSLFAAGDPNSTVERSIDSLPLIPSPVGSSK